jgi:hypothetical protein
LIVFGNILWFVEISGKIPGSWQVHRCWRLRWGLRMAARHGVFQSFVGGQDLVLTRAHGEAPHVSRAGGLQVD